jgi:plastocyanin
MKRRIMVGAIGVAALTVAMSGGPVQAAPTGAKVKVTDFLFVEDEVTVKKGEKVVWKFVEGKHNVTGKKFKSGNQTSGKYKVTFDKVGTFKYSCTLHQPDMDGVVKVVK